MKTILNMVQHSLTTANLRTVQMKLLKPSIAVCLNIELVLNIINFVGISTSLKGPLFTLDRHSHSSLRELEWSL